MDPYAAIAPFYDIEHRNFQEDAAFYVKTLRPGKLLEVGSGTGRLMEPLLDAGFQVWGVEPSPAMMDIAQARIGERARLVLGDIAHLPPEIEFDAVLLPLNTLWHFLSKEERVSLIDDIRQRLVPTGTLILDTTNPLTMADRGSNGEVRERFRTEETRGWIAGYSAAWDDQAAQILTLSLWYDRVSPTGVVKRFGAELDLRYSYQPELDLLLTTCGFRVTHWYGDYDASPYTATSPNLLAVASRA
jgi:SAM-dependent methyltransferase